MRNQQFKWKEWYDYALFHIIKPDSKTKGAQALTIISISEIFIFLEALIFAYQQYRTLEEWTKYKIIDVNA